ncbi:hypothetical protein BU17DRAFT_68084 [Hysterangium stoloniferum]|nr:hypothetical protein BU17DRAFT_68084 [Hysterangium stoloniferum]
MTRRLEIQRLGVGEQIQSSPQCPYCCVYGAVEELVEVRSYSLFSNSLRRVKSVDMVQAYLLMNVYGLPPRRWKEDRCCFMGGWLVAMTKTTLNQNPNLQPPKDSISPRQIISPHGLPPTSHRRVLKRRAAPPAILSSGLVDWETAKELFDIFFKYVSDPVLHTVRNVYERNPCHLTVSISSRYLPSCPRHHNIAMNFPKYAAATAFIDGVKSVEMAQAHLHCVFTDAKVRNCHGAPWVPVLLVQKQQQQQYLRRDSLLTWSFTTSTGDHISLVADLVQAYSSGNDEMVATMYAVSDDQ